MTEDSPIDAPTMANLLEMTGGDRAFVDELVDTYIAEGDQLTRDLVAASGGGAMADVIRPAHSLKSSSLNVGALRLAELCRRLEEEARAGQVAQPAERAAEIELAFREARDALLDERRER